MTSKLRFKKIHSNRLRNLRHSAGVSSRLNLLQDWISHEWTWSFVFPQWHWCQWWPLWETVHLLVVTKGCGLIRHIVFTGQRLSHRPVAGTQTHASTHRLHGERFRNPWRKSVIQAYTRLHTRAGKAGGEDWRSVTSGLYLYRMTPTGILPEKLISHFVLVHQPPRCTVAALLAHVGYLCEFNV